MQETIDEFADKNAKGRFGSGAHLSDYVAIECRLHEQYKIGAAVGDLFDQNAARKSLRDSAATIA
jgi:hypothetical protein